MLAIAVIELTVRRIIDLMLLLMFIRAILSWIPEMSESRFGEFMFTVTEWIIMPVRALFEKLNFSPELPIDIPFLATLLILTVLSCVV